MEFRLMPLNHEYNKIPRKSAADSGSRNLSTGRTTQLHGRRRAATIRLANKKLEESNMAVTLGTGEFRYEVLEDWAKLPTGWTLRDAAAVAVDSKDRVYVFNRSEHPMMVFDRDGNFLRSWGEGVFRNAHGIHIGPDQTLYCTDDGDHTVRKCTLVGRFLLEIGILGI